MLTLALALAAFQAFPEGVSVDVRQDAITDRVSAFAVVTGREGRLAIGCDPHEFGGVRVQIRSRYWLARENFITGARSYPYRFDRDRAYASRWSTSARLGWMDSPRQASEFIAKARVARRVVVRTIDVEGRERDLIFPLVQAQPAIDEVLAICARTAPAPRRRGTFF